MGEYRILSVIQNKFAMEQIKKGGEQRWPIDDAGLRLSSTGTAEPRKMKTALAALYC